MDKINCFLCVNLLNQHYRPFHKSSILMTPFGGRFLLNFFKTGNVLFLCPIPIAGQ